MSSEAPNASWHPALMPQYLPTTAKHAPANNPDALPSPSEPEQTLHPGNDTSAAAAAASLEATRTNAKDASDADEWFPDYDGGSPWQPHGQHGVEAQAGKEQENDAPTESDPVVHPTETPREQDAIEYSRPETTSGAHHASKESFARTVLGQPSWGDDGEAEWSPRGAEADPFEFMPPNDRTNSFPPVPPLQSPGRGEIEPLPAHQAEDVISTVEHESEHHDETPISATANALHQDSFRGDDNPEGAFSTHGYVGGDLQGADEEASDARYAEGLPLINPHEAEAAEGKKNNKPHDPFSPEDGEGGDDFFDQIRATTTSDPEGVVPGKLDRKSTTQVLGRLGAEAHMPTSNMLEDTVEEEHADEDEGPTKPPGAVNSDAIPAATGPEQQTDDLAAKWSQAFAEDDDGDFFLDDPATENKEAKAMDPAAFFGDDDDGFLEDIDDQPTVSQQPQQPLKPGPSLDTHSSGSNSRYLPADAVETPVNQISNPYVPSASPSLVQSPASTSLAAGATPAINPHTVPPPAAPPVSTSYGAAPRKPELHKAQSFADKSKGGYHSPYDLPMDVVRPRKRASMQHLPRGGGTAALHPGPPSGPSRSASIYSQDSHPELSRSVSGPPMQGHPPMQRSGSSTSPPSSSHSNQAPSMPAKPPQSLKSKPSFFEELPMSSKAGPASRTSHKSHPSPSEASFAGPPQQPPHHPPSMMPTPPQESLVGNQPTVSDISKLVQPARVSPYAALPSAANSTASLPLPTATSSRYSPAPSQSSMSNGTVPAGMASRYSPAPLAPRAGGYAPTTAATPPSVLPHMPRTSSPLAHFEVSHDRTRPAAHHSEPVLQRASSSSYEPRLNRIPSLPPTREVEEEEHSASRTSLESAPPISAAQNLASQESQHGQLTIRTRQTPPPPLRSSTQNTRSPPKRKSSYGPPSVIPQQNADFVPPKRSQTSSPGSMYGLRSPIKAIEPIPRPSSAQDPASPSIASVMSTPAPAPALSSRPRGFSQNLNLIPPTDGREKDPLQRWKGAPLITWGVGGTIITSFPKNVPRYGIGSALPAIVRSPGEVKVKHVKDIQPLEERLAKFPGPLKGKSKKRETVAWLTAGIEGLEKTMPNLSFQNDVSLEDKRAVERVLLWKILRLFIEYDGTLEGSEAVDNAVRNVLSPEADRQDEATPPVFAPGTNITGLGGESGATQMQSDSVDSGTVEQLKKFLLRGDREQAVWAAADKRLWGHALLIANTVSPDLYHKVSQEFVKKEVNFPGHNNESLATLYAVLSGNHQESVDELVPSHARAGFQLVAKSSTSGPTTGGLEGLDKWRETLTLILSNRSTGDTLALNSLGNLLSGYGRAEAAHICYLFARNATVFGGFDDPQAHFVLLGSDHKRQAAQFAKETEAVLLSEVYEYGLSLSGAPSTTAGAPHLAVYKLQHAMTLSEHGFRDKAMQYCDVIINQIGSQTRRSPYYHPLLESAVEEMKQRLKEAPKEESTSWIPKPSMNKVSDSVWNRFNKFVAGDDNEDSGSGSPKVGEESGPFARIAGGTPTVSRPPSASNATGMEMFGSPNGYAGGPAPPPVTLSPQMTLASSRYAPVASRPGSGPSPYEPNSTAAPRSSMERTSGEYSRSSYELLRSSSGIHSNGYARSSASAPSQGYPDPGLGISSQPSYQPLSQSDGASGQAAAPVTPNFPPYAPQPQKSSPYAPASTTTAKGDSPYAPSAPASSITAQTPMATTMPYTPSMPQAESQLATANHEPAPSPGFQPPSHGYQPSSTTSAEEPKAGVVEETSSGGYEPPSYGYEPPSYEPDPVANDDGDSGSEARPVEKTKEEKDKENAELFRKAAEEDAKRAEAEKAAKSKKGWGFGSWFGGSSKKESLESSPNKPIRANLGEKSSFYYDPDQKRWINKAAGAEESAPKTATPPPPRSSTPRSVSGTPPPPPAHLGRMSAPPGRSVSTPVSDHSDGTPSAPPPAMMRTASGASLGGPMGPPSAPPSRPHTSMSNASSIDDLLGAAAPRKGGARAKKRGGRYVDVMAK